MSLTIPAAIAAEFASAHRRTAFTELVRLVGSNVTEWLSYRAVSSSDTFDSRDYDPRVLRGGVPTLPFPVGAKQAKVTFRFSDHDAHYTNLMAAGTVFEQGTVSVIHHFTQIAPPGNALGDWTNPYWTGRIVKALPRDGVFEVEAEFGLVGLSRRAYRKFRSACDNNFADGHACPYSVGGGWGRPQNTASGTATGATSTTLVDSGKDFTALGVQTDDWILASHSDGTTKGVAQVTGVGTTTLTVASWTFNQPAAGWTYRVGPEYADCDYLFPSCQERGMAGPSATTPPASLNKVQRKFFVGVGPVYEALFRHVSRNFFGVAKTDRYSYGSGNQTLEGSLVPVPVGNVTLDGLPVLAVGSDGDRVHALIAIGEGRCDRLGKIELDGEQRDDQNLSDPPEQGALNLWGFNGYSGGEESAAVSAGELTEQQRAEAIGQRACWSTTHNQEADTYLKNPWTFSDPNNGFGSYLSHLSAAYLRTDPKEVSFEGRAKAQVLGGVRCRKPGGGWTHQPTAAEFAYELALNRTWGGGVDPGEIDAASVTALDSYMRETVDSGAAPKVPAISSTVDYGPSDAASAVRAGSNDWIHVSDQLDFGYIGAELQITEVGKEQTREVIDVQFIQFTPPVIEDDRWGGPHQPPDERINQPGGFIRVDQDWDGGKIPAAGDTYTLTPKTLVQRHQAAGSPAKDVSVGEALSDALRNGLADHYQSGGMVVFAARKQGSLAAINALDAFTDANDSGRNVLVHPDGKSSLIFDPYPLDKLYNQLNVEYVDAENGGTKTLVVKNQAHQDWLRNTYGKSAKWKIEAKLVLNLVATEQEAVRVGALWLRHFGARPGYHANGRIKFVTPVALGIQLRPIEDVYPVSGANLDPWPWIQYVRIESVSESVEKGWMEIEGIPYVHADYDAPGNGLEFEVPEGSPLEPELAPEIPAIVSVAETLTTDPRGQVQTRLDVTYTLPGDGS